MVKGGEDWNFATINNLVNEEDAIVIKQIPIFSFAQEDKRIFHFEKCGDYSIRSAYKIFMDNIFDKTQLEVDGEWDMLCALISLPVSKSSYGEHVVTTSRQEWTFVARGWMPHPFVFAMTESWRVCHPFTTCDSSWRCWKELQSASKMNDFLDKTNKFKDLFFKILRSIDFNTRDKFGMIFWSIWKSHH